MRETINRWLPWLLMLFAMPLAADALNSNMAAIVSGEGSPDECIAAVMINRIDGEMRSVPGKGFLIEPGTHRINGRALLNVTNCPFTDKNPQIKSAPDLVVNFRAGQTYYIGYQHQSANTDEWELLVWKQE